MALFWKEFKLLVFGQSLGLPMRGLDVGLTTLIVVLNLSAASQTCDLAGNGPGRVLLSTCLDREEDRLTPHPVQDLDKTR